MMSYRLSLLICLISLVGAKAASVEEFKKIQDDIFGECKTRYTFERTGDSIRRLIELIESGDIPAEVQGEQNLGFLKMLHDTCKPGDSLTYDEAIAKLQRLKNISSEAPNFARYLKVCADNVRHESTAAVFERVRTTAKLETRIDSIVSTLAEQVQLAFNPPMRTIRSRGGVIDEDFHKIVLKTLKQLDPKESKRFANNRNNRGNSLSEFMDRIRASCAVFVEVVDPAVEYWPAGRLGLDVDEAYNTLSRLHYALNCCKKVVIDWELIVEASMKDAKRYLA